MEPEISIENQRPDEKVVLVRKRHPWVLFRTGIILVLIVIIVFLLFLLRGASLISIIVLVSGLILTAVYLMIRFYIYNNDFFIITSQRIINVSQMSFFHRQVAEAELSNIQNISHEIKGPVRSLLNFGDIYIATAGQTTGLVLKNVENPHFVQEKIVEMQKKIQTKNQPVIR